MFRKKSSLEKQRLHSSRKSLAFDKKLAKKLSQKRIPSLKQFRYIGRFFSHKERRLASTLFSLFILSSFTLGIQWYYNNTEKVPQVGGEYIEGIIGTPKFINPVLAFTDADLDISKLLFSGLMRYDSTQKLVPDLAESYEISEDQKTYTFILKENIKWHDGENFDADDVLFTIQTIQDSEFKSPLRSNFLGIQTEKVDDRTVKFTLEKPLTPFLESLTVGIIPEHLWISATSDNFALNELNIKPVKAGSGPYTFSSLTKSKAGDIKSYTIELFDDYYGEKPYIEKITFKFYPDLVSATEAAKSGSIEGISFVSTDSKEDLEKYNKKLDFHPLRLPQYTATFFNQNNDILKEKAVREALAYAIDRDRILNEALKGQGEIIHGPILPGYIGYHPDIKKYDLNVPEAEKLLEEADWLRPEITEETPSEENTEEENAEETQEINPNTRTKDDEKLAFTLTTVDLPENIATANILKENWERIGFEIELNIVDSTSIKKDIIKPRNYDALLFGEIVGSDPDPYPFWHSSQNEDPGLNLAIFFNKTIDQLLEEARQITDEEQRKIKYLHFQNLLIEEELPAIFLYNPSYIYGVTKKIQGIENSYITTPSDRFSGIRDWYIKTKRTWKSVNP